MLARHELSVGERVQTLFDNRAAILADQSQGTIDRLLDRVYAKLSACVHERLLIYVD